LGGQIAVLEAAAAAAATVDAEDAAWDDFLDDDAKRMRGFMRKTLQLTREAQQLSHERAVLDRLLREHDMWAATTRALLKHEDDAIKWDDWPANVTRWRALSRAYFTPWTLGQCLVEIKAALVEMHQFAWQRDTTSSGMSMFGWRDQRRLDPAKALIYFCVYKTFRGCDMAHHTQFAWDLYMMQERYQRIVLGDKAVGNVEVLQEISPNISIVRYDERYLGEQFTNHIIYLVYRIELETGSVLGIRSIACPALQRAIHSETDFWGTDCFWFRWELLDGKTRADVDLTCADYTHSVGGSIGGGDLRYAVHWLCEILFVNVRSESEATKKQYLKF
jgi:hypothetical protein